MNPMYSAMIASVVRWALTIASQHVQVSDDQTNNIIAGVVAVAPLIWSLVHKKKVDTAIQSAKAGV